MIESAEGTPIEETCIQLYEIKLILKEMLEEYKKVNRNRPPIPSEGGYQE